MIVGLGRSAGFTLGELQAVLDSLQKLCVAGGAKTAAADLATFSEILAPYADTTVTTFVANIQRKLAAAEKPKKAARKTTVAKPKATINVAAIAQYLVELRDAGTDRAAFEAIFERLQVDKSLKAADFGNIARQYANSVTKFKSIATARDEIMKAFVRQARFENKLK